ncbi:Bestrophin homolog 12 [Caenorhabditis elegans]|uniref:Bestrophin homolog 12 n=1 Tax=Caenorhabditis elegans TaxID=6239 RepID=BST12_CAEEL|nr:Bestrophin homolog 12 [Caenorhabditis elegans]O45363.1 RecName: Full=Bestrophin homolog 12 [Caenorhabditis elegans]CAB05483.1 Bestrophin homolog 12 [Caenorhabditis elegans]|eukprot:NP_507036.1 Bestrophin homolog 12 [Caenorhabditis elegans]
MTIPYLADLKDQTECKTCPKILTRCKGSLYKVILHEFLMTAGAYFGVFLVFRFAINETQREYAAEVFKKLKEQQNVCIPMQMMLAFFIATVADQWEKIFENVGYIENAALAVATFLPDGKEKRDNNGNVILAKVDNSNVRRNIIRYLVLSQILGIRDVSELVKKRFANYDMIKATGVLQDHEEPLLKKVPCKTYAESFVPITWIMSILQKFASKNEENLYYDTVYLEITDFYKKIIKLTRYDLIPIPLAYPQAVFLAVRIYFFFCLFTRQHLDLEENWALSHWGFPLLTTLQFIFLVGCMKVAEILLNPMGQDDENFECNYVMDKNLFVGLTIVSSEHTECPELEEVIGDDYVPWYPDDCKSKEEKNQEELKKYLESVDFQAVTSSDQGENDEVSTMMKVEQNSLLVCGREKFYEGGGFRNSDVYPKQRANYPH